MAHFLSRRIWHCNLYLSPSDLKTDLLVTRDMSYFSAKFWLYRFFVLELEADTVKRRVTDRHTAINAQCCSVKAEPHYLYTGHIQKTYFTADICHICNKAWWPRCDPPAITSDGVSQYSAPEDPRRNARLPIHAFVVFHLFVRTLASSDMQQFPCSCKHVFLCNNVALSF